MEKILCKCGSDQCVKSGFQQNKQRYECKKCKRNFIIAFEPDKISLEAKTLILLMYAIGKTTYRSIAISLNLPHADVSYWIGKFEKIVPEIKNTTKIEKTICSKTEIKELSEINELKRFFYEKYQEFKQSALTTPQEDDKWTILKIEPVDGILAFLIIKHSNHRGKQLSLEAKAIIFLMYVTRNASYRKIATLFNVSHLKVVKWIGKFEKIFPSIKSKRSTNKKMEKANSKAEIVERNNLRESWSFIHDKYQEFEPDWKQWTNPFAKLPKEKWTIVKIEPMEGSFAFLIMHPKNPKLNLYNYDR